MGGCRGLAKIRRRGRGGGGGGGGGCNIFFTFYKLKISLFRVSTL